MIDALERRKKNADNAAKAKTLKEKQEQPAIDEMTLIDSMNKTVVYESQQLKGIEEEKNSIHENKQNKKFYRELNSVLSASDVHHSIKIHLIIIDYP